MAEVVLTVLGVFDVVPGEVDAAAGAFLAHRLKEIHGEGLVVSTDDAKKAQSSSEIHNATQRLRCRPCLLEGVRVSGCLALSGGTYVGF